MPNHQIYNINQTHHYTFVHHFPDDSQSHMSTWSSQQCLCKSEHSCLYLQHIHLCQYSHVHYLPGDSRNHRNMSKCQWYLCMFDCKGVFPQCIRSYLDKFIKTIKEVILKLKWNNTHLRIHVYLLLDDSQNYKNKSSYQVCLYKFENSHVCLQHIHQHLWSEARDHWHMLYTTQLHINHK